MIYELTMKLKLEFHMRKSFRPFDSALLAAHIFLGSHNTQFFPLAKLKEYLKKFFVLVFCLASDELHVIDQVHGVENATRIERRV